MNSTNSSRPALLVLLGAALLACALGGILWFARDGSPRDPQEHGFAPANGVSAPDRSRNEPLADVKSEDHTRIEATPDPAPAAQPAAESVEKTAAQPDYESKYVGKSCPDLIAARIQIEKDVGKRSDEILKQMIKRGECEVLTHKLGEATSPNTPPGWASRIESTPQDDGTEIVRVAKIDPRSLTELAPLLNECDWLGKKIDSTPGGREMARGFPR